MMMTDTMNHVAHASSREHRRVWALLPWLANGTASAEHTSTALSHLRACSDCSEELQTQRRLKQAVEKLVSPMGLDAAEGLRKLVARLDAAAEGIPVRGRQRFRLAVPAIMGTAVIAQALGICLYGVNRPLATPEDSYVTLSSPSEPVPTTPVLRVVPSPDATMGCWQALLQAENLRVVEGPSDAGAYGLALVHGDSAAAVAQSLAHLRASAEVRFAEPVGAP